MTRVLSELLSAQEPEFRTGLLKLENAHGRPSHDIRLTTEVLRAARDKLKLLGLDPDDTTGEELYHMLGQRLASDEARLEKSLRTRAATYISAEGNVMDGALHALQDLPVDKSCFALKTSTLKALLQKQPPKKAMKQLGYRSVASMVKHELAASLLAGAWLSESDAWRRSFAEQYKHLTPRDFETRQLRFFSPTGKRWQKLSQTAVSGQRQNVVALKELGAVVLLPLPADRPTGALTATLTLAVHALNDIRATSSFLKLAVTKPDFGRQVQMAVYGEPHLQVSMLGQSMPWHLLQRYYARAKQLFNTELFEPHLNSDDFSWHAVENVLSHLEPSFSFWHGTAHLGVVHEHKPVSLNVLDVAISYCNKLPFSQRLTHYVRTALWQELTLRYLKHDAIEVAINSQLQPALASEEVLL